MHLCFHVKDKAIHYFWGHLQLSKCFLSLLVFCILWQGFLHIDEYPPDANQGFDIPSAIVVFADFETHAHINESYSLNRPPLISKLQVMYPFVIYDQYF